MTAMLAGKTVAILAANGFDENTMTEIQRALTSAKASFKTIAPEQGLVNGWQDNRWGHYFPVDALIGEALGSDFDILVIPGGERATAKLETNLHTRRIVNHFLEAGKPVAAVGDGVKLLALSPKIAGICVAAPETSQDALVHAGALISDDSTELCNAVLTSEGPANKAWIDEALALFDDSERELQAA
ncbi:MAG: DJ-1/PfpI family protein [Alphaproteobacteria bacterium]|nr:DJ-1/PfpI family protein [Alphaproteobacteria bacterium]